MRRVDDLVQAMGLTGISKSTVSKLCKDIDGRVGAFLGRLNKEVIRRADAVRGFIRTLELGAQRMLNY